MRENAAAMQTETKKLPESGDTRVKYATACPRDRGVGSGVRKIAWRRW